MWIYQGWSKERFVLCLYNTSPLFLWNWNERCVREEAPSYCTCWAPFNEDPSGIQENEDKSERSFRAGCCTAAQELSHRSLAQSLLHSRSGHGEVEEEQRGGSTVWTELWQSWWLVLHSSGPAGAVGGGVKSENSLNTPNTTLGIG